MSGGSERDKIISAKVLEDARRRREEELAQVITEAGDKAVFVKNALELAEKRGIVAKVVGLKSQIEKPK